MKLFSLISLLILIAGATAATFSWDCTNSLGTCQNYCYAATCGRMGRRRFTYDSNLKVKNNRRKASGCSKNPCNKSNLPFAKFGNSCDEFPFASVREGGRGAHLRCVKGRENSSRVFLLLEVHNIALTKAGEGGQLGAFYRKLKNGQKYGITIKNFRGASQCTARPKCKNDGGQFKMNRKGRFVREKRDLELNTTGSALDDFDTDEFEDVESDDYEPREASPLRQLETDDGEIHLAIVDDGDDPIDVGHEIWDEGRNSTVKVVRVIE